MATTIPDLWSDDIKVNVLPPIAILRAQEGRLSQKTQGMLQAKLTTTETDQLVQHQLDLIAPGLNFYRERLLSATHAIDRLYPVTVTALAFAPKPRTPLQAVTASFAHAIDPSLLQRQAVTDDEFIRLVQEVLQSQTVRALIHSLIARINAHETGQPANGPGG